MPKRLFRRRFPRLRERIGRLPDFRRVLGVVLAVVLLGIAWRFGLRREDLPATPAARPSPEADPPQLPGSPVELAVGPAEIRHELFRLLEIGRPVYCGGGRQPVIALTFDDGPGPLTDELLGLLGARSTPATFFLVGSRVASVFGDDLGSRLGPMHAVGSHTWSHASMRGRGRRFRLRELRRAGEVIEEAVGPVRHFRPPYGHRDRKLDRLVNRLGLLEVLWSATAGDDRRTNARRVARTLAPQLRSGAIVLLHEQHATLRALPAVLDEIARRGLRPVTVPELLALDPPSERQLRLGHCRTDEGLRPPEIGGGRP